MSRVGSRGTRPCPRRDLPEATDDDDYSEDGDELSSVAGTAFDHDDGGDDEDEEVDLDGYEEYLARLQSEASERPKSASHSRPMPSESPQFYMVNAHNPAGPAPPPTCRPPSAPRPYRPASARPRLRSDCEGELDARSVNASLRLGGHGGARPSSGIRRKRQTGDAVNPRIRAVYQDGGRASTAGTKRLPRSAAALVAISSKSYVFQQAELHDEYFKLVDVVSELKSACQLEQERRVKALARVRRLEEIVALKDRKIESLLQARAGGGCLDLGAGGISATMAQRDRQHSALVQKLRVKITQQAQMLGAYEEALQTLRSGTKSSNLMELEEERGQLYQELYRLQALLSRQRHEIATRGEQVGSFADIEVSYKEQVAKLQDANKKFQHEKHKLEKEIAFYRSRADNLQQQLSLEQRKRTYDQQVGSNGHVHTPTVSSPNRAVMLSRAIEDMKGLLRKESTASIQRDKLKSPRSGAPSAFRPERTVPIVQKPPVSATEAAVHTPKTPARTSTSSSTQRAQNRPASATPSRPQVGRAPILPSAIVSPQKDDDLGATSASQEGGAGDATSPTIKETVSESQEVVDASAVAPLSHPQAAAQPNLASGGSRCNIESDAPEGVRPHISTSSEGTGTSGILQLTECVTTASSGSEHLGPAWLGFTTATQDFEREPDPRASPEPGEDNGDEEPGASGSNAVKTPSGAEDVDAEPDNTEIHRVKLAEVERMLREVDDDMDNDLESNSSEEFLEIAQLHTSDQHTDTARDRSVEGHQEDDGGLPLKSSATHQPKLSPSSFLSSPSSSSSTSRTSGSHSPSLASLSHGGSTGAADVDEHTQITTDESDDVLTANVEHIAPIAYEPSGYEDGYQSDFTEASSP